MRSGVNSKISEGGRIVIPAEYRHQLGLEIGDSVSISLVNNEIRIMPRSAAIKRAQFLVRKRVPEGRSLVAELREDRRREGARE